MNHGRCAHKHAPQYEYTKQFLKILKARRTISYRDPARKPAAAEKTQQLRALVPLAEVPGTYPSNHMMVHWHR